MQNANLPITVTVTADAPAHINGIRAEIFAESQNRNFNQNNIHTNSPAVMAPKSVAVSENNQPLDLNAGQSQTVNIEIIINAGAEITSQLPKDSAAAGIVHGLQQLQSLSEAMNGDSYTYYLQVSAKVEGVTFGPSKRQPIQLVKPGQIGTGFNINL